MKTISISSDDMQHRVSRFGELKPVPLAESLDMSQQAKDVIYARQLLSVIGLGGDSETPISKGAPIAAAEVHRIATARTCRLTVVHPNGERNRIASERNFVRQSHLVPVASRRIHRPLEVALRIAV